ncbi:barstar (barnase inhibitor) [Paenibacillus taihuensis]|uniref:Barstar (Barnase inhibitor) n=1 Tax=Paenibacillus taihuensis TaxID=1156355 RepID=A0A3D9SL33_9BACL|nr:barstar family protein [Paenibacillus taihuensis]REE94613.1 barstar (barnase inhibitor) [Paenibacillus taihuensis]
MGYHYSIIDDEDDTVIGYCNEIEVIKQQDDAVCSVLAILGFQLSDESKKVVKLPLSNFRIHYLNNEGVSLGGYYFTANRSINLMSLELLDTNSFEISGQFTEEPMPFAHDIWLKRRENPKVCGQWVRCSLEEKRAWLQVVRLSGHSPQSDRTDQLITIDGSLILDLESFYVCLGEAINGPFGYFGDSLDSLSDCLCGGFGLVPPFTLVWRNYHNSFCNGAANHDGYLTLLLEILTSRGCEVQLIA